jgi:hypothetical protein
MIAAIYARKSTTSARRQCTRWVAVLGGLLLGGCANTGDLKPGVIRGLDGRGYVKKTEGFGLVARGCPDAEVRQAALDAVTSVRPRDWRIGDQLIAGDRPYPRPRR